MPHRSPRYWSGSSLTVTSKSTHNTLSLHSDVSCPFHHPSPRLCHCSPQTQIVLVDGLFECDGVEQILSAAGTMETKPYLVITVAQAHSRGSSLHNLMFKHPVRMVTCTPQSEPVNHILPRQLRRQVLELKAVRRLVTSGWCERRLCMCW